MVCYASTGHLFKLKNMTRGTAGGRNHFATFPAWCWPHVGEGSCWPPGRGADARPSPGKGGRARQALFRSQPQGPGARKLCLQLDLNLSF